MNQKIIFKPLVDFIDLAKEGNIDFAKITYNCGARDFVEEFAEFDCARGDGLIRTYDFKDFYKEKKYRQFNSYYVVAIPYRSYLMYEFNDDITIWVCFTEETFRCEGYIRKLLQYLIEKNQNEKIKIDTFNESLRRTCRSLGIVILKER